MITIMANKDDVIMFSVKVKINGADVCVLRAEAGQDLYPLLISSNIYIDAPCGGNCFCGKCKIHVSPNNYESVSARERALLTEKDMADDIRLACGYKINSDTVVNIPSSQNAQVVTGGSVSVGELCSGGEGFGVSVDIGTTTVAVYLYSLKTGEKLCESGALNAQKPYGADVITRIQYINENEDGLKRLQSVIITQLDSVISELCGKSEIGTGDIKTITVAGNTTMLHILAGESPSSLAVAPFTPVFLDERVYNAGDLGFKCGAELVLLPSVFAYVGADITAGILACGMHKAEKMTLFVDIGTNGEMALGNKDGILCCATAAGPAFEGAKISCGMGGTAGAINSFAIKDGVCEYSTIGNMPHAGICGSAVIDVVYELVKTGIIEPTGFMEEDFVIADNITFTTRDVREVQLAKAAVAAGIATLCEYAGIKTENIDECIIAGGFGQFIDKKSACGIGLIPAELEDKITFAGNTSGAGAAMCLLSEAKRAECNSIARNVKYIELSGKREFEEKYVDCMFFE